MADAVMVGSPIVSGPIRDLDQSLEALFSFAGRRKLGRVSLEVMGRAMALLGDPHLRLRVVHVAGTSGKTSTCYYLRGLLQACGFNTGMTVSPHIAALNERVQIGAAAMAAPQFCARLDEMLARLAPMRGQLTYFESVICLALSSFADQLVDYAVVEVGVGGGHDATNILSGPDKVAVITAIGLDHTEKLGPTLAAIAAHKAGIIAPGGVAVVAPQPDEALAVIEDRASVVGASLVMVEPPLAMDGGSAITPFQAQNWAVAQAVVTHLAARDGFTLPAQGEMDRLATRIAPPGRFEWHHLAGHRVLLDGAHNPPEMASLVNALIGLGIGPIPVLATLSSAPIDKVVRTLGALQPIASRLIVPEFRLGHADKVKSSLAASQVAAIATEAGIPTDVIPDLDAALAALLAQPTPDLLVTGSLYLAGLVRPHLIRLARPAIE